MCLNNIVSISSRGSSINCTCQVQLGSKGVMAAQRSHTASPESAEIIPPHVTFTVSLSPKATSRHLENTACCGGVVGLIWGLEKNLFPLLQSVQYSVVCIHCQSGKLSLPVCVVVARLLCMLCCRGCRVDVRLSCCHSVLIWGETSV